MKQRILLIVMALVLPVAGVTSCVKSDHLGGTSWRLVSYGGQAVLAGTQVSLDFDAGSSQVNGRAGCNTYGGESRVSGENIRISNIYQTEMACRNPGVMEQETAYLNLLAKAESWDIPTADLHIHCEGGEVLIFERVIKATPLTSLAGTSWELNTFVDGQAASSTLAGTVITLSFGAGDIMEGSAGCNTYSARYETVNGSLIISDLSQTKRSCLEPAGIMLQESRYLEFLKLAERFEATADRLTIYCRGVQWLVFAPD